MKIRSKKNKKRKECKTIVGVEAEVEVTEEVTGNLVVVTANLVAVQEAVEVVVLVPRLLLVTLKNLSLKVKMTIRCTLHQLVSK